MLIVESPLDLRSTEGTLPPLSFFVQMTRAEHETRAQCEGVEIEFAGWEGDEDGCAEEEAERGVMLEGLVGGREVGGLALGGLWFGHGVCRFWRGGGEEERRGMGVGGPFCTFVGLEMRGGVSGMGAKGLGSLT